MEIKETASAPRQYRIIADEDELQAIRAAYRQAVGEKIQLLRRTNRKLSEAETLQARMCNVNGAFEVDGSGVLDLASVLRGFAEDSEEEVGEIVETIPRNHLYRYGIPAELLVLGRTAMALANQLSGVKLELNFGTIPVLDKEPDGRPPLPPVGPQQ